MSGKNELAEEYRAAAEAYRQEAQRCPTPAARAALEAEAKAMEDRYLNLTGRGQVRAVRRPHAQEETFRLDS